MSVLIKVRYSKLLDGSSLDSCVRSVIAEQGIPGMGLLISRRGIPEVARGYGLANVELSVPVTDETVFAIASVTKLFTAQAVMQLVEKERVALDAPIHEYLPQLPVAWESAHIRHILNHSSGIPNYTDVAEYWHSTRLDVSRDAILGLVEDKPLDFPGGSNWSYSNTGYYLLGMMIEAVSGQNYGDYLHDHIFAPLGMSATCVNDPYRIVPGRAAGYTLEDRELRNAEYYSPAGTYAAGVLLSSLRDLAKWDTAMYEDTILPQRIIHEMWAPAEEAKPIEKRAGFTTCLGWFVFDNFWGQKVRWAGHNGGVKGFSSSLVHFLDKEITIILLMNRDGFDRPDRLIADIIPSSLL